MAFDFVVGSAYCAPPRVIANALVGERPIWYEISAWKEGITKKQKKGCRNEAHAGKYNHPWRGKMPMFVVCCFFVFSFVVFVIVIDNVFVLCYLWYISIFVSVSPTEIWW